jgi:prolyl-tRNA editing enzyme YbaK/EbsC (Cys-tRNA(Pro) deacylase)
MQTFNVEAGIVSPILFDAKVPTHETVFCGIGRPDRTLEILLTDLVQITQGRIAPLTHDLA